MSMKEVSMDKFRECVTTLYLKGLDWFGLKIDVEDAYCTDINTSTERHLMALICFMNRGVSFLSQCFWYNHVPDGILGVHNQNWTSANSHTSFLSDLWGRFRIKTVPSFSRKHCLGYMRME